jgi:murein DD-endopeptidase MepM/ murein hydrolase activator NlpD
VAVQDGYVKYADDKIGGYGNMIVIEHANKVFSVYAHLDKMMVDKGDRVKRGEVIAHTGNTGRSTGPHLHFEIRVHDKARDPAQYLGMAKKP